MAVVTRAVSQPGLAIHLGGCRAIRLVCLLARGRPACALHPRSSPRPSQSHSLRSLCRQHLSLTLHTQSRTLPWTHPEILLLAATRDADGTSLRGADLRCRWTLGCPKDSPTLLLPPGAPHTYCHQPPPQVVLNVCRAPDIELGAE